MGEAINLVENFKIEKVIFNCGEFKGIGERNQIVKIIDKMHDIIITGCGKYVKRIKIISDKR